MDHSRDKKQREDKPQIERKCATHVVKNSEHLE